MEFTQGGIVSGTIINLNHYWRLVRIMKRKMVQLFLMYCSLVAHWLVSHQYLVRTISTLTNLYTQIDGYVQKSHFFDTILGVYFTMYHATFKCKNRSIWTRAHFAFDT